MVAPDVEPLGSFAWIERTHKLRERFLEPVESDELESAIRRLYYHILLAPRPLRPMIGCTIDEAEFERYLDVGAFDTAAMALIGCGVGIVLQKKAGANEFEAVASVGDDCQTQSMCHSRPAGAIMGALLECLGQICDRLDLLISPDGQLPSHQDLHKSQFELHPRKNLH